MPCPCELHGRSWAHLSLIKEPVLRDRVWSMRVAACVLLCCVMLLPAPSAATGAFWTKAQQTLLLSQTREDSDPLPPTRVTRDRILDMPGFLPLCGNGRIDTRADYAAFYANPRNLPMNLTKQQLLPAWAGLGNASAAHNLTILADEECDDGNRLDLDGCSADCMLMDLWTSPCEIAVDRASLVYEDIIYDARRGAMVVSALDGVYSLNVGLNDTAVRAVRLAPKSFPATNLFRQADSLVVYSAKHQSFWRLADGGSSLTLLRNFSGTGPGQLSEWRDRGHCNDDGSIVVHDRARVLYFSTPLAAPVACDGPEVHRCMFVSSTGPLSLFQCDNFTAKAAVTVGPGTCEITRHDVVANNGNTLLQDVLEMTMRQVGFMRTFRSNMDAVVSPPEPRMAVFSYVVAYSPWGALIEAPTAAARALASPGTAPLTHRMHSLGDPWLALAISGQVNNCGPGRCGFDTPLRYDLLAANPLLNVATTATWGSVLQGMIQAEALQPPTITNLSALRADPARYNRLISTFADMFQWSTTGLAVLAFETHPASRSLWAVRGDRLVVIPKSGVLLQRADGKCIPSGAALCPACQWAPSGRACRPCSEQDPASWAWTAKCKARTCSGRRLLSETNTTIRFTLAGNLTAVREAWPSAVARDGFISVEVATADPAGEMRSIRLRLALMAPGVQVLTQPYERVPVDTPPPARTTTPTPAGTPKPGDDTTALVTTAVALGVVAVLIVAYLVYSATATPAYQPVNRA